MHGYRSSHGNPRRESNPWIEDNLEKEIKRLKDEKLEWYWCNVIEVIDKEC